LEAALPCAVHVYAKDHHPHPIALTRMAVQLRWNTVATPDQLHAACTLVHTYFEERRQRMADCRPSVFDIMMTFM
jgi:hypothetical protein